VDDRLAGRRAPEALEQLLENEACGEHEPPVFERFSQSSNFGKRWGIVPPQRERPHTRVNEQPHPRERSAL